MSDNLEKMYAHYREGDNQFRIAGGVEGLQKLANGFYDPMETLPEAKHILALHPATLGIWHGTFARCANDHQNNSCNG